MLNAGILLAILLIGVVFFVFFVLSLVRWQMQREELKKKAVELLVRRSYRILSILDVVSDRYLPIQIKLLLVDYLLDLIPSLISKSAEAEDLANKLSELTELRDKLNAGIQETRDEKVTSKVYLSKTQQALSALPQILREFSENQTIDKSTSRRFVSLVRFSINLARYDLLIRGAEMDLEADKKARALEKYRTALSELEKVSIIEEASSEIQWVKQQITDVESMLFVNQSTI